MRKRPFIIIFVAVCCFLFPAFLIVQSMIIKKVSLAMAIKWYLKTPRNMVPFSSYDCIIATVIAYIAGYGIFRVRLWGWWYFLLIMLSVVGWNIWAFASAPFHTTVYQAAFYVFTGFSLGLVFLLLFREIRAPYFNPRLRWWQTPPRYAVTIECPLGKILDIAIGGVFIESDLERELGGSETLRFTAFDQEVEVEGSIVWVCPGGETKPKGFGLKFLEVPPPARKGLKLITKELKKLGKKNRQYEHEKASAGRAAG